MIAAPASTSTTTSYEVAILLILFLTIAAAAVALMATRLATLRSRKREEDDRANFDRLKQEFDNFRDRALYRPDPPSQSAPHIEPDALRAGQYLIITYDADADLPLDDLLDLLEKVFVLFGGIIGLLGNKPYEAEIADSIKVGRLRYGSPLEVILIVQGVQAGVGALVGISVGVNAAVQKMRRSWTKTARIQAEDKRSVSRDQLEAELFDQLKGIVKGEIEPAKIATLAQAADGLRSIAYLDVEEPLAIEALPANSDQPAIE